MFRFVIGFACVLAGASAFLDDAAAQVQIQPPAAAPPSGPLQILRPAISPDLRIVWEVKNRFRLFRREADFLKVRFEREMSSIQELDGRVRIVASEGFGAHRNKVKVAQTKRTGSQTRNCEGSALKKTHRQLLINASRSALMTSACVVGMP